MKKSEAYKLAILAVTNSKMPEDAKVNVLSVIVADYNLAVWDEKNGGKKTYAEAVASDE